jgi:hypothetical protein
MDDKNEIRDIVLAMTDLEVGCERCLGSGVCSGRKCAWCEGSGRQATEFGQKVIAFLRRHYKLEPHPEQI